MYLTAMLTALSYPEIGRQFGGRDHTTVMHAVRAVEGFIATISASLRMSGCEVTLGALTPFSSAEKY